MNKTTNEIPPAGEPEQQDALQSIHGIGPAYAKALHQIGIHHPADLVHHTPESLAQELREKAGMKVPPDRIAAKDWIGQARKLIETQAAELEPAPDPLAASETTEPEQSAGNEPSEWRERGMFTIKFLSHEDSEGHQEWRIKVYAEGGPGAFDRFDGLEPSHWVEWIYDQMKLPVEAPKKKIAEDHPAAEPSLAGAQPPAQQPPDPEKVVFDFEEVDVNPWPQSPKRRLEVEARIKLAAESASDLAQNPVPFQIEFYLINLENNASSHIGSELKQTEPDQDVYDVRENFAIPAPGKYEVQTILLLPKQGTAAFQSGPTFQVM